MTDISRKEKWIWLTQEAKISKSKVIRLYDHFKSIDSIFNAQREDLENLSFLKDDDIANLCNKKMSVTQAICHSLKKYNIDVISLDDPIYPNSIKCISNYPSVLYVRGQIKNLNTSVCISVVGSRTPSDYGLSATRALGKALSQKGFTVVSGMADGVDSAAHKACIENGGFTVAVLGCGADVVYPKNNFNLYSKILDSGMIITEYPPGTLPDKFRFPERNKLIAALSLATVVTEANLKSGSLITANHASKYKRDVFALPGNITSSMSGGTNELIKKGAVPITNVDDIYFRYKDNPYLHSNRNINCTSREYNYDEKESVILKSLEGGSLSIDEISYITGISLNELNTVLLFMEIKEYIVKTGADKYALVIN